MNRLLDRRSVLGGALLLTALIAFGWLYRPWQSRIAIPLPDVTAAHPKVAVALQKLEGELRRDPTSSARWGELGMVLMAHGWNTEAVAAFEQAAQHDPGELRWVYLRAILQEGIDLGRSAEFYRQAATLDPNYASLRYRWAHVLIKLDQLSAAEEQLQAAAQLAPQSPHPLLALGRTAIGRKDLPTAHTYFQKAASVAPFCREAREQLARTDFLQGDRERAQRDQELASGMPPAYPGLSDPILQEVNQRELVARQSAERADQLVASGNAVAAATAFQQLIQDRPDLSRPRLNLAALLAMQGDMRQAAAVYREITELFPNEALAYQGMGGVLAEVGDFEGAVKAYQECIRIKPDYAQVHHTLGLLWQQRGKLAEASAAYRSAIHADVRFAPAHLALGLSLQEKGDFVGAIASIENAVRLAPNDAVPRGYLQQARQAQRPAAGTQQNSGGEKKGTDDHD